ncbi:DUF5133 domain-containing protein [Streptomyces sp. NPDC002763]|uniref:DUF5133 domain-containing protein n=1 Tax=Streptomyces sp. NPDC002763 TaxID=3154427 RepID=UPI0033279EFE
MLRTHPSHLRELVGRCETLRRRLAYEDGVETARQLEDMTHTLCVITAPAGWTGCSQRPVGGSSILRRSGRLSSAGIRVVRRPRR